MYKEFTKTKINGKDEFREVFLKSVTATVVTTTATGLCTLFPSTGHICPFSSANVSPEFVLCFMTFYTENS